MLARHSLTKVCPCVGGRCLTASLSRDKVTVSIGSRSNSTSAAPQSIFDPHVSHWDKIFDEYQNEPPQIDLALRSIRHLKSNPSTGQQAGKASRRLAMNEREAYVVADMFNSVFRISQNKSSGPSVGGIGHVRTRGVGLFSRFRQSTSAQKLRWTSEADEDLDRKKEEMELCETDLQLLEWAMREVFGESQRFEEEARRAAEAPLNAADSSNAASSPPRTAVSSGALQLQPASYPYLLAALMRTFREKYKDPHLALAMFNHARNLSVASFVFGCTSPAYNELIETRWTCFRDLRGVCQALEEMRVNGVELDNRTRLLAETVRREAGDRTMWQEESSFGSGEVWEMIGRLEQLAVRERPQRRRVDESGGNKLRSRKWSAESETWKSRAMEIGAKDGWQFGDWQQQTKKPGTDKRKLAMRY